MNKIKSLLFVAYFIGGCFCLMAPPLPIRALPQGSFDCWVKLSSENYLIPPLDTWGAFSIVASAPTHIVTRTISSVKIAQKLNPSKSFTVTVASGNALYFIIPSLDVVDPLVQINAALAAAKSIVDPVVSLVNTSVGARNDARKSLTDIASQISGFALSTLPW